MGSIYIEGPREPHEDGFLIFSDFDTAATLFNQLLQAIAQPGKVVVQDGAFDADGEGCSLNVGIVPPEDWKRHGFKQAYWGIGHDGKTERCLGLGC